MATIHATLECGREVHHGGCTCAKDAEIAALKAEVERLTGLLDDADQVTRDALGHARAGWEGERERLTRALAAGPAALRAHGRSEGHLRVASMDGCAEMVEAAQEAAMKEGT